MAELRSRSPAGTATTRVAILSFALCPYQPCLLEPGLVAGGNIQRVARCEDQCEGTASGAEIRCLKPQILASQTEKSQQMTVRQAQLLPDITRAAGIEIMAVL